MASKVHGVEQFADNGSKTVKGSDQFGLFGKYRFTIRLKSKNMYDSPLGESFFFLEAVSVKNCNSKA